MRFVTHSADKQLSQSEKRGAGERHSDPSQSSAAAGRAAEEVLFEYGNHELTDHRLTLYC